MNHQRESGGVDRSGSRLQYERRGMLGPEQLLTRSEACQLANDFEIQIARSGNSRTRNRHVDLPALARLCANPKVWQPLHEILGDELLLWRTNLFLGNPALPWHEDRHDRLFDRQCFSLSLMLAIDDNPPDNCAVFIPGSHGLSVTEKESRYGIQAMPKASGNVRYEGQIAMEFCEPIHLKAGQAILMHPRVLHASSGHLTGQFEPRGDRKSLTFRVTLPGARFREAAFPDECETSSTVLRTIRRATVTRHVAH